MNRESVVTTLQAALSDVMEREVGPLDESVRLAEDLHLDSTSMLELLMALEEAFELEVDPEDLNVEDFATLGTLADFVQRSTPARAVAG
jgi:acyl carrier protein